MRLTKKQLNMATNWLGSILVTVGIAADSIPLDSIVAWAAGLNPTVAALAFGVGTLFYAQGKGTKDD